MPRAAFNLSSQAIFSSVMVGGSGFDGLIEVVARRMIGCRHVLQRMMHRSDESFHLYPWSHPFPRQSRAQQSMLYHLVECSFPFTGNVRWNFLRQKQICYDARPSSRVAHNREISRCSPLRVRWLIVRLKSPLFSSVQLTSRVKPMQKNVLSLFTCI